MHEQIYLQIQVVEQANSTEEYLSQDRLWVLARQRDVEYLQRRRAIIKDIAQFVVILSLYQCADVLQQNTVEWECLY